GDTRGAGGRLRLRRVPGLLSALDRRGGVGPRGHAGGGGPAAGGALGPGRRRRGTRPGGGGEGGAGAGRGRRGAEPGGAGSGGAVTEAERQAEASGVRGPAVTPFLLSRLAELTEGKSLRANQELIVANAELAAEVAKALVGC